MKNLYQTRKSTSLFLEFLLFANIFLVLSVVQANEQIKFGLLLGEWKMVSIFDQDLKRTTTFDANLNNGIIFTDKEAIEVIHKDVAKKSYKMAHDYQLKENCVVIKYPEKDVCWSVITLTKNKLILDTPIGVINLKR